jgi:hypothetical protein
VLALANAKKKSYEGARKVVHDELFDSIARARQLLKAIDHSYKALIDETERHAKDCVGFQTALLRLEEAPAEAHFPDTSADYQLVCKQGVAQVKKVRAVNKRQRTSLLQTLAVLGNDDDDLTAD